MEHIPEDLFKMGNHWCKFEGEFSNGKRLGAGKLLLNNSDIIEG